MDEIRTWTKPATVASVEDYVKLTYAPREDDAFYLAHGYEQWLIRNYKQNFAALCIISEPDYQRYHLAEFLQGFATWEMALLGRPLVRATKIIERYLQTSVRVGHLGVAFAAGGPKTLTLFFQGNHLFKPIFDWVTNDQIEPTDYFFESIDQVNSLTDWTTLAYGSQAEGRFVKGLSCDTYARPGVPLLNPETVYYVFGAFSGSMGYQNYSMDVAPALPRASGKGWKKPAKKDAQRVHGIMREHVERIRVVD